MKALNLLCVMQSGCPHAWSTDRAHMRLPDILYSENLLCQSLTDLFFIIPLGL